MSITITSPPTYVDRTQDIIVSWTNSDSTRNSAQSSFELQYKLKSDSSWSPGGTGTTAKSVNLKTALFDYAGVDATEYYYRILVRYNSYTVSVGTESGYEYSPVYNIMFHGASTGTMKIYDGSTTHNYPIYDTVSNMPSLKTSEGAIPLVESSSPLAENAKVNTADGVKFIAKTTPALSSPGIRGSGTFYGTTTRYYSTNYGYKYYQYISGYRHNYGYYRYISGYTDTYSTYTYISGYTHRYGYYHSSTTTNYRSDKYYHSSTTTNYAYASSSYQDGYYQSGSYVWIPNYDDRYYTYYSYVKSYQALAYYTFYTYSYTYSYKYAYRYYYYQARGSRSYRNIVGSLKYRYYYYNARGTYSYKYTFVYSYRVTRYRVRNYAYYYYYRRTEYGEKGASWWYNNQYEQQGYKNAQATGDYKAWIVHYARRYAYRYYSYISSYTNNYTRYTYISSYTNNYSSYYVNTTTNYKNDRYYLSRRDTNYKYDRTYYTNTSTLYAYNRTYQYIASYNNLNYNYTYYTTT